jgi:hypothetical protein
MNLLIEVQGNAAGIQTNYIPCFQLQQLSIGLFCFYHTESFVLTDFSSWKTEYGGRRLF